MLNKKSPSINHKSISHAAKSDYEKLTNFFNRARRIHRHLDWFNPLEWLGQQPFLIERTGDQIIAALCAVPENQKAAWVRVFSILDEKSPTLIWNEMLYEVIQDLEKLEVKQLASLLRHPWFKPLLEQSCFQHHQDIVVLEWQGELPDTSRLNNEIGIRTMQVTDLPMVEKIDKLAFPPLWQNSLAGLTKAFNQTGISTVAVKEGELVGYQISTAMTIYGHLARLAVLPSFQRQGIAFALVYDLLKRFEQMGFWRVTVNTQSDNYSSRKLYEKFDFKSTGEEIPVYVHNL
jgi:ribosomal protein S18 acetylase RimI-like enzyme